MYTILAVHSPGKFDDGFSNKYFGRYCQTVSEDDRLVCFKKSSVCHEICAFDGQLSASVDNRVFVLDEVPKPRFSSPEFDPPPVPMMFKERYVPPMSHPWRYAAFIDAQDKVRKALLRS